VPGRTTGTRLLPDQDRQIAGPGRSPLIDS